MLGVTVKVAGVALLLMLSGCGQKGPLYRDHQGPSASIASESVQAAPASQDVRDDEAAVD